MTLEDGPSALQSVLPVSRETIVRLQAFVSLLKKWQPAENLVSAKTLPEIWSRHIADSAQLLRFFPEAKRWLDMGTGAGLPGMVLAICLVGEGAGHVHLVESNRRKCSFLRAAVRETGAPATVHEGRAEEVLRQWTVPIDRITARAVAPLTDLLAMAEPVMGQGVPAVFPKGRDFQAEVDAARQQWDFDLHQHDSLVGEGGVILDIGTLKRRAESG